MKALICAFACLKDPDGRFGAGTELKIFEAMASGIPIVSTDIGCRGIDVSNGKHVLITNDEVEFSKCVINLIQNNVLTEKLIKNSPELIKEKYYWKKIVDELESEIMKIISKKLFKTDYRKIYDSENI